MQIARVDQEHMCACAVYDNVHVPRPLSLRMFPRTGTTRLVTSNCHAPSGMQALQLPLSLSFHSCYKRARDFLTWSWCGLKLMYTHTDIDIQQQLMELWFSTAGASSTPLQVTSKATCLRTRNECSISYLCPDCHVVLHFDRSRDQEQQRQQQLQQVGTRWTRRTSRRIKQLVSKVLAAAR